jgi:hypothetical protein
MLIAPPQCQDSTNHVVSPLIGPNTDDAMDAALLGLATGS